MLAVCEAVKVYLDVPGLAFVIGCNRSALTTGGLLEDLSPAGAAFMEKNFQTNYRLPPPTEDEAAAFVRECARSSGITPLLTTDLVHLLVSHANRNPRRIKRIINGLALESTLNPVWREVDDSSIESMVRVILLQYLYPGFYRQLTEYAPQRNLLSEFLLYRKAMRSTLGAEAGPVQDEQVEAFYVDYDVSPPGRNDGDDPAELFGKLESRVPSWFPTLAYDRSFISLTEELWNSGANSGLIREVLSRPPVSVTGPADDGKDAPGGGFVDDVEGAPSSSRSYSGKRILWIDDNPRNNAGYTSVLQSAGAHVVSARNRDEATRNLTDRNWDIIISDVARSGDPEAGFTDLKSFRKAGLAHCPVIFYVGKVSAERVRRASELGAIGITAHPYELRRLTEKALGEA